MGSVHTDHGEVKEGNFVDLSEKDGELLIAEGVVEPAEKAEEEAKAEKADKKKAEKAKAKAIAKAEKEADKKAKDEAEKAQPSIDWTRKELDEYAIKLGIKDLEKFEFKKQVLKAIEAVVKKGEK